MGNETETHTQALVLPQGNIAMLTLFNQATSESSASIKLGMMRSSDNFGFKPYLQSLAKKAAIIQKGNKL
jgi:hypothetical protein